MLACFFLLSFLCFDLVKFESFYSTVVLFFFFEETFNSRRLIIYGYGVFLALCLVPTVSEIEKMQ